MRRAVLVLALAAAVYAANAQLTILPQAGLQNPTTKISYNNLPYFSPIDQLQPQIAMRVSYKFKNGLGPFLGLSTSRSMVDYKFTDPENGMTAYDAAVAKTQLQLQGGIQYCTKPIYFKQKSSTTTSKTTTSETTGSCHNYYSSCSRYLSSCSRARSTEKSKSQKQSWSMRIQPSAGFGFIPSDKPELISEMVGGQSSYTYNAGNLKTAFLTGVGFEFAKNKSRLFTLSVNYFKGLGSNETTFTTQSATKTTTTTLNSKVAGWNASIGIPIGFSKKSTSSIKTVREHKSSYDCQQYRIEHHYRCGKVI